MSLDSFFGSGSAPRPAKSLKAAPARAKAPSVVRAAAKLAHDLPDEISNLATWAPGSRAPFGFLVSMFLEIESESGRNAMIDILTRYLLALSLRSPDDIVPFAFLCTGELRPAMEGVKLDLGESIIIEALASSTGRTVEQIKLDYTSNGDLSKIAKRSSTTQGRIDVMFGRCHEALTVHSVYKSLLEIAQTQGGNSRRNKVGRVAKLLTSTKDDEVKFIIRCLEGSLAIGFAVSSLLVAIGRAFLMRDYYVGRSKRQPTSEELVDAGKTFKRVFHGFPILDTLLRHLLDNGFPGLEESCGCQPGIPIMSMLAKPAKSTTEIKKRIGEDVPITCEYKYDGERAQIHKLRGGKIMIFSRNTKSTTDQFGDMLPVFSENVNADEFIIDSEIVAYDTSKDIILPFQTLMHRSRKGSDEPSPIQVCCFAFDCLYHNGKSLLTQPLDKRRAVLHSIVTPVSRKLQFATYLNTDLDHLSDFFNEAVRNRTEGLMIKTRDGAYEPGKRAQTWAKLKKDYIQGLGTSEEASKISDCVDCVVIGGTYGKGKRAGLIGCYLLAIWNDEVGKFQAICEVGTGFSDAALSSFTERFSALAVTRPPSDVEYGRNECDVFFRPEAVWEVGAADLTVSPKSRACFGDLSGSPESGISLRFARFLRERDDKAPRQCTNSHQILDMYFAQDNVKESRK